MWKYIQKIQHLPPTHENSFTRAVTVFMSSRWLWEILPGQKESHGSHKVFPWWTKIYLWAVSEAVFCKGMLHVFIMCTLSRELRFRKNLKFDQKNDETSKIHSQRSWRFSWQPCVVRDGVNSLTKVLLVDCVTSWTLTYDLLWIEDEQLALISAVISYTDLN